VQNFCEQIIQQDNIWYVSQGELAEYLSRLEYLQITDKAIHNSEDNGEVWIRQGEGGRVLKAGEVLKF